MQEKSDPFAIPDGLEIGDNYKVPFNHPEKGEVEITVYLMGDEEEGQIVRCVSSGDATILSKKSQETANKIFKGLQRYEPPLIGNMLMLRYDDVKKAIAAAYKLKKASPKSKGT